MKTIYFLSAQVGKHTDQLIETKKQDFFRWIDNLSTEFEIIKKFRISQFNNKMIEYYFKDYYNELNLIGRIINPEE